MVNRYRLRYRIKGELLEFELTGKDWHQVVEDVTHAFKKILTKQQLNDLVLINVVEL